MLNDFLRFDINIVASIVLALIFVHAIHRLSFKDKLERLYIIACIIIFVQLWIETITCIINGQPGSISYWSSVLLHIALFIIAPLMTFIWYRFVHTMMLPNDVVSKSMKYVLIIPVIINTILVLLSPVLKLVYYIDEFNVYHRGPWFVVSAIITYFYFFVAFIVIYVNRRKLIRADYIPMMIFGLLPIIGGIIQSFFYGLLLMWSSTAFSLVIVYLYLQQRLIQLDHLTKVWTRGSFDDYIIKRLKSQKHEEFGAIYLDMDGLKTINDQYGHNEGDLVIASTIEIIRHLIQPNDIIARMGGDEFIILVNTTDKAVLDQLIDSFNQAIDQINQQQKKDYQISCSFGADIYSTNFNSIEKFIKHIDELMYESKKNKKNPKIIQ